MANSCRLGHSKSSDTDSVDMPYLEVSNSADEVNANIGANTFGVLNLNIFIWTLNQSLDEYGVKDGSVDLHQL